MSLPFALLSGLCAACLGAGGLAADLLITEIVDGPLPGGLPKFVELTNTGPIPVDLGGYSIGNYNNGSSFLGGGRSTLLQGLLAAGESYVVSYESGDAPGTGTFLAVYGVDPSFFELGPFINGNDVVALFLADGSGPNGEAIGNGLDATRIDVYGVIGTDGSGEVWDYAKGYAHRCGDLASPVFDPSDWLFSGPGALTDGCGGDPDCLRDRLLLRTDPFVHARCAGPGVAYCFGDGSGSPCPCGNPGGAGEGCANSAGHGGVLAARGSASVGAADLVLCGAHLVAGQAALFFQGDGPAGGGNGVFFGDGLRCAAGNVLRIEVAFPDAGGEASSTVDVAAKNRVLAGETRRYQLWYRDPKGGPCGYGFNLSNGLEITFAP